MTPREVCTLSASVHVPVEFADPLVSRSPITSDDAMPECTCSVLPALPVDVLLANS